MLNAIELEKKWLHYKIKSYIPHISFTLIVLFISISTLIIYHNTSKKSRDTLPINAEVNETNSSITNVKTIVPTTTSIASSTELNNTDFITQSPTSSKILIKPSLAFENKIETSIIVDELSKPNNEQRRSPSPIPPPKEQKMETSPPQEAVQEVKAAPQIEADPIEIEKHSVDEDLSDVITRFKKTNNPVLSLFLAKKYYSMKNYDQAYNYALVTNQLDNKIDMSWIIFSKSLVKLGQKDMAISTLKTYINNSRSPNAAALLEEIQEGRFQ